MIPPGAAQRPGAGDEIREPQPVAGHRAGRPGSRRRHVQGNGQERGRDDRGIKSGAAGGEVWKVTSRPRRDEQECRLQRWRFDTEPRFPGLVCHESRIGRLPG